MCGVVIVLYCMGMKVTRVHSVLIIFNSLSFYWPVLFYVGGQGVAWDIWWVGGWHVVFDTWPPGSLTMDI